MCSDRILSAYVPREVIQLGLSPLDTLSLLVLMSLPQGLWGTQQWFADLLGKDKSQMSRVIKNLREHQLIYEDFTDGRSSLRVNTDKVNAIYEERLKKGLIKVGPQNPALIGCMDFTALNNHEINNTTKNYACGKTCGEIVGNLNIDGVDVDNISTQELTISQHCVDYMSTIYKR